MEINYHTTKWNTGQRINLKGKNYFEQIENEDTIYQNVWHATKAMFKVKYSLNTYIKKEESFRINDLGFYITQLKKDDCVKSDIKEKG